MITVKVDFPCFNCLSFLEKLRSILGEGNIDDIIEIVTPKALTKCDTNALLMAMEVGYGASLRLGPNVVLCQK